MRLFYEATHAIGAVFFQIALALLFEELSFAGLARLILAPRPAGATHREPQTPGECKCLR